jgi:hypothetical protein
MACTEGSVVESRNEADRWKVAASYSVGTEMLVKNPGGITTLKDKECL